MENPELKILQNYLTDFFAYFREEHILSIADNKDSPPFVHVIYTEGLLALSFAADYFYTERAVEIALWCGKITQTVLTDCFFISATGKTHYGDDARKYYELESEFPLEEIEPMQKTMH